MARVFGTSSQSSRRLPADTRIAIIGAGSSGVMAACSLVDKGYRRITLFEASDRIGGKVETVQIDGQWIELGAVMALRSNKSLYRMARGGLTRPMPHNFWVAEAPGDGRSWLPSEKYWKRSRFEVAAGVLAFNRLLWRPDFRCIFQPGFYHLHRDLLSLTMAEFATAHGFAAIMEPFQVALYVKGYGPMTSVPALYPLKLMPYFEKAILMRRLSLGLHPGVWMFERYQKFWEDAVAERVARGQRIRPGCKVTSVGREAAPGRPARIAIAADGKNEAFDFLIVATPPNQTLEYLDVSQEERSLFGRVQYFDYCSVLFRASGVDENACVSLRYN